MNEVAEQERSANPLVHPLVRYGFRFCLAIFLAGFGAKIGSGYSHLCPAGSKFLEGAASIGTGIVIGIMVACIPNYKVSLPVACAILLAVYFLRQPYLDWVHGPNSPW